MRSLASIIGKNLRVISRSKVSTSLVLLAPILIVFLVGTAFSSDSLHNLKLGVYSSGYTELTDSLITDLESKQFVSQRMDSPEACMDAVKDAIIHVCVIFPPNLSVVGGEEAIIIYADNSRINLAYTITNEINSQISARGSEIGVVMAQALLDAIQDMKTALPTHRSSIDSVSNGLRSINTKSKSVSTDIEALGSAITKLDKAITTLNAMNTSSSVTSLKSDITAIKTQLTSLRSEAGSEVTFIDATSETTGGQLDSVSRQLDELTASLLTLRADSAEEIVLPIRTEIRPLTNDSTSWKYLFPTLVALITLLSSIVLSSSMVFAERKARSHFRNFMTPTADVSFVMGTYLTCLLVIGAQLGVLFAGTVYLTSISVSSIIGPIALILFLTASCFIFLGMFIGYIFKSDESTVLASISISSLLIFFSNTILPTEIISGWLRYLALYNPFFVADALLRKAILFNSPWSALLQQLLVLGAAVVILFIATLVGRKMTKRAL